MLSKFYFLIVFCMLGFSKALPVLFSENGPESSNKFLPDYTFRIGVITDDDELTQDPNDNKEWLSWFWKGNLEVFGSSTDNVSVSVNWDSKSTKLSSGYSYHRRGMELSTLNVFNGSLYACDDKTGILFNLREEDGKLKPTPWVVLANGNFVGKRGFKCEWAAVKDDHLYVGSHGFDKEDEDDPNLIDRNNKYVKVISPEGAVEIINWSDNFDLISSAVNINYPGYVKHEAVAWSDIHRMWLFAPRRISRVPLDDEDDNFQGSNVFITASEDFSEIKVRTAGEIIPTHGFSSVKFLPVQDDTVIVALKSMELNQPRMFETYFMVFDIEGRIIFPETLIDSKHKFEGLTFL